MDFSGWFLSPVLHGRVPAPHPRSSFFDEFGVTGSIFVHSRYQPLSLPRSIMSFLGFHGARSSGIN